MSPNNSKVYTTNLDRILISFPIAESQLAAQGHGVVENLEREIRRLEEELNFSRRENEVSSISKSNRDLIEHLRRKIFVYENAQKVWQIIQ